MFCPSHLKGVCGCKTKLRRDWAEPRILDEISKRILSNPSWFNAVFKETIKSWKEREQRAPAEFATAEQALADVVQKISRLVDRIENGFEDPEIKQRLEERRAERRELVNKLKQHKRLNEVRGPEPTKKWLADQLQQLGEILIGDNPAAAFALRKLLGDKSKIVVKEIRQEGRKHHYLQGILKIQSSGLTDAAVGSSFEDSSESCDQSDSRYEEIVIDFVAPKPSNVKSERAFELHKRGLMGTQIAEELDCSRSSVGRLLNDAYVRRGEVRPKGKPGPPKAT